MDPGKSGIRLKDTAEHNAYIKRLKSQMEDLLTKIATEEQQEACSQAPRRLSPHPVNIARRGSNLELMRLYDSREYKMPQQELLELQVKLQMEIEKEEKARLIQIEQEEFKPVAETKEGNKRTTWTKVVEILLSILLVYLLHCCFKEFIHYSSIEKKFSSFYVQSSGLIWNQPLGDFPILLPSASPSWAKGEGGGGKGRAIILSALPINPFKTPVSSFQRTGVGFMPQGKKELWGIEYNQKSFKNTVELISKKPYRDKTLQLERVEFYTFKTARIVFGELELLFSYLVDFPLPQVSLISQPPTGTYKTVSMSRMGWKIAVLITRINRQCVIFDPGGKVISDLLIHTPGVQFGIRNSNFDF
ncbi:uncharacterized protein LOC141566280 [Sminthopsis crassicaudata]|uniref:uncharacterized protein LOC141566279 n=1 Tax=Sminthopsis crassicaudata TaxID=9301 RepID=UPI003D699DBA